MGDLREDLIRLAEEWEIESDRRTRAGDYGDEAMAKCSARLREILASHPAPSPSVSRDAETCRERSSVGHGCRREAGHEGRHRDRHGNEWAAPSPRSEAESGAPNATKGAGRG